MTTKAKMPRPPCAFCGKPVPVGRRVNCGRLECLRLSARRAARRHYWGVIVEKPEPPTPIVRVCVVCNRPLPLATRPNRITHLGFCTRVRRAETTLNHYYRHHDEVRAKQRAYDEAKRQKVGVSQ